ncbi:MAG: hypothetical protein Q9225_002297 [Loekoesia sp. 1 TL-2023]
MNCFALLRALFWSHGTKEDPMGEEIHTQTIARSHTESVSEARKTEDLIEETSACEEGITLKRKTKQMMALNRMGHFFNLRRSVRPLNPTVQDLCSLIENDTSVQQLFTRMFREVPKYPPYSKDPRGNPQVRSYHAMLQHLDNIVAKAPEFDSTILTGFPINAMLAWPMATPSGVAAFLNEKVNVHIRNILNSWAVFLSSPRSTYVLNDDPERGWFGSKALSLMPNFVNDYICDPVLPHYGFTSWDDFFTRKFRKGVRPVERPNDASIIANACESTPYRLAYGVKMHDHFWMKDQSYSLEDMLAGDPLTSKFFGGTVFQAYLACINYHRWHSPVSGTIKKAYRQAGAYYAQCPSVGFDRSTPNGSQAYLTHVAARAMIFIEADNPEIGLMCFMAVGIAECSSCEITVCKGQRVKKGDELGMFHYGGSTYCLIFRPEIELRFMDKAQKPGSVFRVNSALASVDDL